MASDNHRIDWGEIKIDSARDDRRLLLKRNATYKQTQTITERSKELGTFQLINR